MKSNIKVGGVANVAIGSLQGYPTNPRRGDIEAIALSLKAHGQYRPIVVQYGSNYILAGNHTYKAAKKLGWKKIKVTYVDCDEQTVSRTSQPITNHFSKIYCLAFPNLKVLDSHSRKWRASTD